jgi:hypothetical protein
VARPAKELSKFDDRSEIARDGRIAEEVELVVWLVAASIIVLAIDDFRFVRM